MFPIDATDWNVPRLPKIAKLRIAKCLGKLISTQKSGSVETCRISTPKKSNKKKRCQLFIQNHQIKHTKQHLVAPTTTSSHAQWFRSPVSTSRLVSLAQLTSAINGGYHQKEKPQKETFDSKRHRLEGERGVGGFKRQKSVVLNTKKTKTCTWNAKCPILLGNFTPETSNYCLTKRALGFPGMCIMLVHLP